MVRRTGVGSSARRTHRARPRIANGLFVTTQRTDRILAHYERLCRQTRGLVDWRLVHNPGNHASPVEPPLDPPPRQLLPERHRQLVEQGSLLPGYADVVTLCAAWTLPHRHTWVMEYDVDFAGHWRRFFLPFADNGADLLTTTLLPLSRDPGWWFARSCRAPDGVDRTRFMRSFNPLMRMSRRFIEAYVSEVRRRAWYGHFEFTLATVARHRGLRMEDLGGTGPFCPPGRRGTLYTNAPLDVRLRPGTFIFRPPRAFYFAERRDGFRPGHLHHPVKPPPA